MEYRKYFDEIFNFITACSIKVLQIENFMKRVPLDNYFSKYTKLDSSVNSEREFLEDEMQK